MKPESKDRLMGFSTSFGITFLAMMVVLGTVCFLSYFRLGRETAEEARPDAYLPEAEDRLVMLVAPAEEAGMAPDSFLLPGFLPDKGEDRPLRPAPLHLPGIRRPGQHSGPPVAAGGAGVRPEGPGPVPGNPH